MRTISITAQVPDDAGKYLKTDYDLWLYWSKVTIGGPTECWPYKGSDVFNGYCQHRVGTDKVLAHRVAYLDVVGPIPEGQRLRHSCALHSCCNPAHVEFGTRGRPPSKLPASRAGKRVLRNAPHST